MLGVLPSHFNDEGAGDFGVFFRNDVENVEIPVPLLAGRSSQAAKRRKRTEHHPEFDLRLYVVEAELRDARSSGTCSAGTMMKPQGVCQTLPEEVVEAVLLRLPAAAQARCRAVCKDWLAMLNHAEFPRRSFLQALSLTTPPLLCGVGMVRPGPEVKAWKVDLSFLPKVFRSSKAQLQECSLYGFLCMSRLVPEGMLSCLFNPVNQGFKVLPMLEMRWSFGNVVLTGTVATESIPRFKVYVLDVGPVAACRRPVNHSLFKDGAIYDSVSGEWKGFLAPSEQLYLECSIVACNGDLYTAVLGNPMRLVRKSTERGLRYLWNVPLPLSTEGRGELSDIE